MSEPITYVVTFDEEGWAARDPSKRVRGVAVGDNLTRLERDLEQIHRWAFPEDPPGVEFVFDLPEDLAHLVEAYKDAKAMAERYAKESLRLAKEAATALTGRWSEPDTARILGLSKQRVHQLKASA